MSNNARILILFTISLNLLTLVLQPVAPALRAIYLQMLTKSYVMRKSHTRVPTRREHIVTYVVRRRKRVSCCVRSTITESETARRKQARSERGASACPVLEILKGYMLCWSPAINKDYKCSGTCTGTCMYGRL